jgi:hypothetical protein
MDGPEPFCRATATEVTEMPKYHIDILRGPLVVKSFDYEAINAPSACNGANDWLEKQALPLAEASRAQISQGRDIIATREPIADGVWSLANI